MNPRPNELYKIVQNCLSAKNIQSIRITHRCLLNIFLCQLRITGVAISQR